MLRKNITIRLRISGRVSVVLFNSRVHFVCNGDSKVRAFGAKACAASTFLHMKKSSYLEQRENIKMNLLLRETARVACFPVGTMRRHARLVFLVGKICGSGANDALNPHSSENACTGACS